MVVLHANGLIALGAAEFFDHMMDSSTTWITLSSLAMGTYAYGWEVLVREVTHRLRPDPNWHSCWM